ncbi:uncharacterized protein [Ambystoma mexicanum]|uniref:uncharacterized protein n=1 Tax=Ambystoma mexicanum TaxID=8296 RepID=UPI0037E78FF8
MALECFQALLAFTGDGPCPPNMEVHLIHRILQICRESRKAPELQQEVYCQVLKQMTYNKSLARDSCFRCYQILYIMTAYFPCCEPLLGTVQQYLKTVSRCGSKSLVVVARACFQQLQRSTSIGGRVYYPSPMEIKALLVGKGLRWIFVNLPGAQRQSVKVHMGTTVGDVTQRLCERLGVTVKEHVEEYGITWGESAEKLQGPLRSSLYIMDLLQDLQSRERASQELWFYRISWTEKLVLDHKLSIDMQYHQVLRLYETGQLLMRREHEPISQAERASRLAALKHRATGACFPPNRCELKASIPADMWPAYDEDYWMKKVLFYLDELLQKRRSATEAKMMFLDIASSFPLFGTTLLLLANLRPGQVHTRPTNARACAHRKDGAVDWTSLPEQVLVNIYSLLPLPERFSMSLSCKEWSLAFRSPALWRKVTIRVESGSAHPWILMLLQYGHLMESVRILWNDDNGTQASAIVEHLVHLRRSKLQSLTLISGEDFGSNFNSLQESLGILFDVSPGNTSGFRVVDFTHLSGQLEDATLISLAISNPSLERLLIANRQPAIRLQPSSLLTILRSCRRLSHLAVWNSALAEDVALSFLQRIRAPLQLLELHYDGSTSGIMSNQVWKKLKEQLPKLEVSLHFSADMDGGLMLGVLQPDIPLTSLDIASGSSLSAVLCHVAHQYHHRIKDVTIHGLETPEGAAAAMVLRKRCGQLQQITYCSPT